ncbi:putative redox protein, regulator of disulfide bond formation [Lachnospiraceae bacterium JC7]|nr:putative redox protein, regulator of disulfide bond formation [Lachnospiraceae bacterium JC7]
MESVKDIDVRGLSCPEPVMITTMALKKYKGQALRVIASEAHVSTNVQKLLKKNNIAFELSNESNDYVISFTA